MVKLQITQRVRRTTTELRSGQSNTDQIAVVLEYI